MTIPMDPQRIDMMAPTAKARAVSTPSEASGAVAKVITMNMAATKMRQIRYYCLRNSTAP